MDLELCLKIDEAARAVGISRSKLYTLIAAGELPVVRLGRSVRVRHQDLEEWVELHLEAARWPAAPLAV